MRILVLNWRDWQHPWAGGAEVMLREVTTRLAARGHDVTLFCQRAPGQDAEQMLDGVRVIREGGRWKHLLFSSAWLLKYQWDYDAVWEFTNKLPYGGPLLVRRPLVAAAMHINGATATQELGTFGWVFMAVERGMYWLYRKTPFVAISGSTRSELVALGADPETVHVVHCGIDGDYFRGPHLPRANAPTVICVSRLKRYKRIDLLVAAMKNVLHIVPDARLVIVGTGDQEANLRQTVETSELGDHVLFTGHVSEAKKRALLDEAWLQVQPSMKEGWGLSIVEAGARMCPSIAFDVPGLRDSIVDGITGVIVRTQTPEALAEEIAGLLRDTARRTSMGQMAHERALSFSWDGASDGVERVLMQVCAQRSKSLRLDPAYESGR